MADFEMADFEMADEFLPVYDVSDAVATVADADREAAWAVSARKGRSPLRRCVDRLGQTDTNVPEGK